MTFFSPPPRREARVFSRLPARYRMVRTNAWTRANAVGRDVHSVLEGPSFDAQGRLYVTDVAFGRIFRVDVHGAWDLVAEYDGWPNGLKIACDGRIFVTDYKRGLLRISSTTGEITQILDGYQSEGFKGLNDLFFTSNGDLYFTDQGQTGLQDPSGRIFRLRGDGTLQLLLDGIPSPNGLVVDEARQVLYVAVTRANQIWRLPLHANGQTSKVGVFSQLHGGPAGPDGLALDADGGLLVAHAGFGTVWHLDRLAEPVARISTGGMIPTNVAFAPGSSTLFITEAEEACILQIDLDVQGLPLYSHAGSPGS